MLEQVLLGCHGYRWCMSFRSLSRILFKNRSSFFQQSHHIKIKSTVIFFICVCSVVTMFIEFR